MQMIYISTVSIKKSIELAINKKADLVHPLKFLDSEAQAKVILFH